MECACPPPHQHANMKTRPRTQSVIGKVLLPGRKTVIAMKEFAVIKCKSPVHKTVSVPRRLVLEVIVEIRRPCTAHVIPGTRRTAQAVWNVSKRFASKETGKAALLMMNVQILALTHCVPPSPTPPALVTPETGETMMTAPQGFFVTTASVKPAHHVLKTQSVPVTTHALEGIAERRLQQEERVI